VAWLEQAYATALMPAKLALDLNYVRRRNFWWDIAILCQSRAAVLPWGSSEPALNRHT
jgi:lipopolysaccharide/colanic/teichoic acid biosynthesis glycosyltransferase